MNDPEGGDDEEIFERGALRWRGLQAKKWIALGQKFLGDGSRLRSEIPDHAADSGQQKDEADDAPHDGAARRLIADERLVRPVLGVGDVAAGTVGGSGPCRPPEECAHGAELFGIGESAFLDGVLRAAVGENICVVMTQIGEGRDTSRVDGDGLVGGVIGVTAYGRLQALAERSLLFSGKRFVAGRAQFFGPVVEEKYAFAMQPIGTPVGCDVGAMTPDGADFLASNGLPGVLSILNDRAGE